MGGNYYLDLVWNHDGFSDWNSKDSAGNTFSAAGGYPGFVLTYGTPAASNYDPYGDFHNPNDTSTPGSRLAGLIDIRMGSGIYVKAHKPALRAAPATTAGEDTGPLKQLRARWLIEGETAALAARHASSADIKVLRELNRRLTTVNPEDRVPPDPA